MGVFPSISVFGGALFEEAINRIEGDLTTSVLTLFVTAGGNVRS